MFRLNKKYGSLFLYVAVTASIFYFGVFQAGVALSEDIHYLRLQRTFKGGSCSSGEVYVDGRLVSLYLSSDENSIDQAHPFVADGRLTVSSVQDLQDPLKRNFSRFYIESSGRNIEMRSSISGVSFSKVSKFNRRSDWGGVFFLTPYLSNRSCTDDVLESPFSNEKFDVGIAILNQLGLPNGGGVVERMFFIWDLPSASIAFEDKLGKILINQSQISGSFCPNFYEKLNSTVRNQSVLGFVQCSKWKMQDGDLSEFIEMSRSTKFLALMNEKWFATMLGIPLFSIYYVPILAGKDDSQVWKVNLTTDPPIKIGEFERVDQK